jgi:hypothetical protein
LFVGHFVFRGASDKSSCFLLKRKRHTQAAGFIEFSDFKRDSRQAIAHKSTFRRRTAVSMRAPERKTPILQ